MQTLVFCPVHQSGDADLLLAAAKDLEAKLKAAGVGFVIEVRDIRQGHRLFRVIDGAALGGQATQGPD